VKVNFRSVKMAQHFSGSVCEGVPDEFNSISRLSKVDVPLKWVGFAETTENLQPN
jgi:hypothetical protein